MDRPALPAIVPGDQPHRFLIHDRDAIYAAAVDDAISAMGLTVLKTPVRCPQANAFGERLIGTIRRECLDWLVVLMNDIYGRSCESGWRITTRADHMRASARAFPTRRQTGSRSQTGITFPPVTA
jgi:transposase InsO family protein